MNIDRFFSMVTVAALVGLFILNADSAIKIIDAAANGTVKYIGALQGRG